MPLVDGTDPDWVERLWLDRLEQIATNLATDGQEHLEIASLARHIEADYGGRFLIELIQNASDQAKHAGLAGSSIHIVHVDGLIAVTNQGTPFDAERVQSITNLGLSPKEAGFAIGNKGVGFKSVFEVSGAVTLAELR